MPKYVDADKILHLMWDALYQYEDDIEKKNGLNTTERLDVQNGFEIAHKVVVDAPAEDVAPVIHAFWFWNDDINQRKELQCSNCGKFVKNHGNLPYLEFTETFQYCPKCGAKMDEIYLTIRLEGE